MPRRRVGESASTARAAIVGAISPAACRSRSTPWIAPVPVTDEDVAVERRCARPCARGCRAAGRPAAWSGRASRARRPCRPRPSPRTGTGRRSTGRARRARRARRCGPARPPRSRGASRRPARPRPAARPRSSRCAAGSAASARCAARRGRARTARPRAAGRRRTGWTPTRRRPPARRAPTPRPCTVNGRCPGSPSSSTRTPSACSARMTGPIGRDERLDVALEVHRAVGERGDGGQEPHDRAGQAAVDRHVSRAACRARRASRCRGPPSTPSVSSARRHEVGVARGEHAAQQARGVGERGEHEVAVAQRLRAGHGHDRVQRPGRERGRPEGSGRGRHAAQASRRRRRARRTRPRCGRPCAGVSRPSSACGAPRRVARAPRDAGSGLPRVLHAP